MKRVTSKWPLNRLESYWIIPTCRNLVSQHTFTSLSQLSPSIHNHQRPSSSPITSQHHACPLSPKNLPHSPSASKHAAKTVLEASNPYNASSHRMTKHHQRPRNTPYHLRTAVSLACIARQEQGYKDPKLTITTCLDQGY
jgi:hypothetical protein